MKIKQSKLNKLFLNIKEIIMNKNFKINLKNFMNGKMWWKMLKNTLDIYLYLIKKRKLK